MKTETVKCPQCGGTADVTTPTRPDNYKRYDCRDCRRWSAGPATDAPFAKAKKPAPAKAPKQKASKKKK